MKLLGRQFLGIALAAVVMIGCSCSSLTPSGPGSRGMDVPTPGNDGGSSEVGNPALKAQNLAVVGTIVQQPLPDQASPDAEPVVAGQFTLTWDPPLSPAVVALYRVERKIDQSGTWATIADDIPAQAERKVVDPGEFGATHYYRIVTYDAVGNYGTSDEVSAKIPTFCDYPSGWSMVWPPHGCARFESTFVLDAATTYFAGHKLIVREDDGTHPATYEAIDIGPDLVLKDICAVDRDHVYAVGYAQAPREKARGAAIAITGGAVKRLDLTGLERGPLLRVFCDSAGKFYAGGANGVFLQCDTNGCAPVAGVDDPDQEKPFMANWGVPGQFVITGVTINSLVLMKPDSPPAPLILQQAAADQRARDPAVLDLWGRGGGVNRSNLASFFVAADDGLYRFQEGTLRKIDDGRYRRLWGWWLDDFYAIGDGIFHYRFPLHNNALGFRKTSEGPPLEFTSIHGSGPFLFYLIDSTGQIFRGDGQGHYEFLLNIWRGGFSQLRSPFWGKSLRPEVATIAAVTPKLLAIFFRGMDEGLGFFSPSDGSMWMDPTFRGADVYGLTPTQGRILISSSIGLFAMEIGEDHAISKLVDGIFTSAWDCGKEGICAVGASGPSMLREGMFPEAADAIFLITPQAAVQKRAIAGQYGETSRFRQAWGTPENLFAVAPRKDGNGKHDTLLFFEDRHWTEAQLPAPPAGTESTRLRIVSAPVFSRERPVLVAKYLAGQETTFALIAFRDGRWTEIDRGDHVRPIVEMASTGETTLGILDAPFETTSLSADGFWAVGDGKFLFRKTR